LSNMCALLCVAEEKEKSVEAGGKGVEN